MYGALFCIVLRAGMPVKVQFAHYYVSLLMLTKIKDDMFAVSGASPIFSWVEPT